jgi:hypothetical protein
MDRALVCLSIASLLACSGGETPTPPVTPEPAPTPAAENPAPEPATTPPVPEAPPEPPPEPTGTESFALGDEGPLTVLVRRYLALPPSARPHARIAAGPHATSGRLLVVETTAARAAELATAASVSSEAMATLPEGIVTLAEVQASQSVNVHDRPAIVTALPRTLPHGGFAVELLGAIAGGTSSTEGAHPWVYVVAADEDNGWASAHFLGARGACERPPLDTFVAALPEAAREAAALDAAVGITTVHRAGADADVAWFVARTGEGEESYLAMYELSACVLGARILLREYSGDVNDFELPRATREGDSLLLVGATPNDPPGLTYWSLARLGDEPAAWQGELMSDSVLAPEERIRVETPYDEGTAYEPVEITYPEGRHSVIRWNDGHPEEDDLEG